MFLRTMIAAACLSCGCALEGGFGWGVEPRLGESAVRGRFGASVRKSRGDGPFVGGDLLFTDTPSGALRAVLLRTGYAWWWYPLSRHQVGLDVSLLGGLGAVPYGPESERGLGGYYVAGGVAAPFALCGGGDMHQGFAIGTAALLLVPEVTAGLWIPPGSSGFDGARFDLAGTMSVRVWVRSDLTTLESIDHMERAQ